MVLQKLLKMLGNYIIFIRDILPELVVMVTAVNYKGSIKLEILSFSTGGGICTSHLKRERKKMGCERKREYLTVQPRVGENHPTLLCVL